MRKQCEYLWAKRRRKTREMFIFRVKTAKRMQANMAHEIDSEITANDLAQKLGKGVDGIRIKYSRLFAEGHPLFVAGFDRHAPLSPEQIQILAPEKRGQKASIPKAGKKTGEPTFRPQPSLSESPLTWKAWVFIACAFVLVIGHAALIWFDMATLWAMPGKIGGGIAFLFIFSGMILMSERSEKMVLIRENMLWAIGTLEALAVVVHHAAFYHNASVAYSVGLGSAALWGLVSVICLLSIGATIFYQKVIRL